MNLVHISLSVHFVWLVWLSLQYYDHDAAIARIMGLVLPNNDVVEADDSGVLDDVDDLDSSLASREERLQLHDNDSYVHHSKDLVTVETEIPSHKRHQINENKKKRSTSEVMRADSLLSGSIKKSSEINLERKSVLKNDNKFAGDFSRRLVQNSNESDVKTKCFLTSYDNSTFVHTFDQSNIPNETATFALDLELLADKYASEMDWYFINQAEENNLLIDSKNDDIDLLPNVANRFKYSCFVTHKNQENQTSAVDVKKSNTCYLFTMSDEYGDGICCWGGSGFYSLKLNENIPLMSGRFYAYVDESKFCLGDDEPTTNVENKEVLYPSRECIGETCFCDSKPKLLSNFENIESRYSILRELKSRTMLNIVTLSGTESLKDKNSPQYMAACWTLNDDPYLPEYSNITTEELDAETRMMQRYILAVLYFATKPQNWNYDMNFLTSLSECEWMTKDEENDPIGIGCDTKNNIISVLFDMLNLDGVLVDELSGLKSLEFIAIVREPKMNGSIPSSFGLLSELRYLNLEDVSLISTIPPELFDARKMERLMIVRTSITGTIPNSISKTTGMQVLRLRENHLTGEIPEELYSLTQLRQLFLNDNKLSSTISSSIGNLNNLKILLLGQNNLSGPLPSELGRLIMLEEMTLSNNEFTSTVPSSLKYLSNAVTISLNENNFEGEVPYALCELNPLPDIRADCRNDILQPDIKCTCCSYCFDSTPTWNGKCPDSTLKIVIDHIEDGYWFTSESLEWSITDTTTNKQIIGDKYMRGSPLKPQYEICVSSTDCLSLNMTTGAINNIHDYPEFSHVGFKTPYSIYWNDNLLITDTVASDMYKSVIHPEIIIQHDLVTNQVQEADTCVKEDEMICNGEVILLDPKQRVLYNNAIRVSGKAAFDDVDSPHSKALCWIIKNDSLYDETDIGMLEDLFTQRYVLTLLHLVSVSGLFGNGEYPPLSNECSWEGITCTDEENKMFSLSLSPAANQIIGSTLIEEIGSLAFLEILQLSQTAIEGQLPETFSNLYSLREFNLSENALNGTISDNFFNQLKLLELFDLSDNNMTGEIPVSIGSNLNIEVIRLSHNKFTGELPLDNFTTFSLKKLDVSENHLSGSISPSLLKHRDLEYLDIGFNFFVGSIEETIFGHLTRLKHFDISQNELTGVIPSVYHNASHITYFDVHKNRFTGTFPKSLSNIATLEYVNLQGNKITGSIPFELNNLENIHTLVLSHNQFKGSIPISFEKLPKMNILRLQANQLSGEAPIANKEMKEYITDCGYPSVSSSDPINCPSCSICCNSDNLCAKQRATVIGPVLISCIFILSLLSVMMFIYAVKQKVMNADSISKRFEESVDYWQASEIIGDKSVYHFFLTPSVEGWFIGLFCAIAQLATLYLFITAADITSEISDLKYTVTCPANGLECDDKNTLSVFGYLIFALILFGWLMKDIIASIKLFMLALWKKNVDFFFASVILFLVTSLAIWTSAYYNIAIAIKDTELIVYSVILLFVNELDERLFMLVQTCNLSFAGAVEESIARASYHERSSALNVTRGLNKVRKRLNGLRTSSMLRRSSNNINDKSVVTNNSNSKKNKSDPMILDVVVEEEGIENRNVSPLHCDSIVGSSEKSIL